MKILRKSTFPRKHTHPNVAILHLWVYCVPIFIYFSGQKWDLKCFRFSPIIKSRLSYYNLKKGGKARFSTGKFMFWALALHMANKAMVDRNKVLKVGVSKINILVGVSFQVCLVFDEIGIYLLFLQVKKP